MLDLLDKFIVHEFLDSLPAPERALAELLMQGHTQTTAADKLGITGRAVRYQMGNIRWAFTCGQPRAP